MTKTTMKNTSELAVGDVVSHYGMRIALEAGGPYEHQAGVFGFHGRVLNVDEVDEDGVVPKGWRVHYLPSGELDPEYPVGAYWAIQGNELAHWSVEA